MLISSKLSSCKSDIVLSCLFSAPQIVGMYKFTNQDGSASWSGWHHVSITKKTDRSYKWTNKAGDTWTLYQKDDCNFKANQTTLHVGEDCPCHRVGYTKAVFKNNGVYGPLGEFFKYVGKGML